MLDRFNTPCGHEISQFSSLLQISKIQTKNLHFFLSESIYKKTIQKKHLVFQGNLVLHIFLLKKRCGQCITDI